MASAPLHVQWSDFLQHAFPAGCVSVEIDGEYLVMLDSTIAGAIDQFTRAGAMDEDRHAALVRDSEALARRLNRIEAASRPYFEQLLHLSNQVRAAVQQPAR